MRDSVDATSLNKQPEYENNLWAYLYYMAFIIVGAFFFLNLFIGVMIDNFSKIKNEVRGGVMLLIREALLLSMKPNTKARLTFSTERVLNTQTCDTPVCHEKKHIAHLLFSNRVTGGTGGRRKLFLKTLLRKTVGPEVSRFSGARAFEQLTSASV